MDNHEELLEQFRSISGLDEERSKFYLESAAWDIEAALSSLYEDDQDQPEELPKSNDLGGNHKSEKPLDMPEIEVSDTDSEDEEGQAFYAGGSEHSGQQVIGPSKKKKDVVSSLFKAAKKHGAEVVEPGSGRPSGSKKTFSGVGYKLGETESDSEVVTDKSAKAKKAKPKEVTLKMWRTGFSVDNGPLRSFDDPENAQFLSSVKRGQVPSELVKLAKGGEVYINMEDHRQEDFQQDKVKVAAFSGSGQVLGSIAPDFAGQGAVGTKSSQNSNDTPDTKELENKAKEDLNLDESQPVTNIQIRLPDGSRLIIKLNHSHTIGDIRSYISTSRPHLLADFMLMTTFPYVQLKDSAKTVVEANIQNAALVVK